MPEKIFMQSVERRMDLLYIIAWRLKTAVK